MWFIIHVIHKAYILCNKGRQKKDAIKTQSVIHHTCHSQSIYPSFFQPLIIANTNHPPFHTSSSPFITNHQQSTFIRCQVPSLSALYCKHWKGQHYQVQRRRYPPIYYESFDWNGYFAAFCGSSEYANFSKSQLSFGTYPDNYKNPALVGKPYVAINNIPNNKIHIITVSNSFTRDTFDVFWSILVLPWWGSSGSCP